MTRLLYISVCLRTRQYTISYSFIYIIQKAEFQDIRIGNMGLESGESMGNIGLESGENRGLESGEEIRGKKSGEQGTGNRRLESGETEDWNQGKQGTGIRGKKSGEQGTGCTRLAVVFH